jgi:hypothetical protein
MSVLVVLMMAFALVSSVEAEWFPYRCGVEGPAYTDYIDARALPCTERDRDSSGRVTEPMGSPGAN